MSMLDRSDNRVAGFVMKGQLSIDDIERVGMNIRDWIRQTGS